MYLLCYHFDTLLRLSLSSNTWRKIVEGGFMLPLVKTQEWVDIDNIIRSAIFDRVIFFYPY